MAKELVFEGIDFGEGPRWRDGRLWFSDFYQHKVRAVTPAGEAEDIIRQAGTGIFAPPNDSAAIAKVVLELFQQHCAGGIKLNPNWNFINKFHVDQQQKLFAQLINSILSNTIDTSDNISTQRQVHSGANNV